LPSWCRWPRNTTACPSNYPSPRCPRRAPIRRAAARAQEPPRRSRPLPHRAASLSPTAAAAGPPPLLAPANTTGRPGSARAQSMPGRASIAGAAKPQQELPDLAPLTADVERHLEEVHLRLAGTVHQRHEHLGRPPPQLAQVAADRRHSDLEAFLDQLPVQPRSRDPLLGRRPRPPLIEQRCDPRPHPVENRAGAGLALHSHRGRHRRCLRTVLRLTRSCRATDRTLWPSHQHLVMDNMVADS
jgi:hypothetical protein